MKMKKLIHSDFLNTTAIVNGTASFHVTYIVHWHTLDAQMRYKNEIAKK